jgi:flagellar hook-associated protein 1
MSLDTALSGALSSLKTVQQQISLVSNNINNANTPGYTRKTVSLSPVGDGVELVGVKISDYRRATDSTLLKQLNSALADSSGKAAQKTYLSQVQDILGASSDNTKFVTHLEAFASAWRQLQAEPENTALQSEVISSGNNFAADIRLIAGKVEQLDRAIQSDTSTAVTEFNNALRDVEKANADIAQARATGTATGDYEDQRDVALQKIAQYADIRALERGNGQVAIYTPQGYGILDGKAQQFSFSGSTITLVGGTGSANGNLQGGKLAALLNLRADTSPAAASTDPTQEVIRKLRNQLDTLANSFLTATTAPDSFAQAYNSATSNTGALATGFFTGSSRTDFAVNSSLVDGSATVKRLAATAVADAMKTETRSFSAYGQTTNNVSYTGFAQEIVSVWQSGSKRTNDEADTAESQTNYFKKLYTDKSGVNVDEELISLQTLQRSYQSAARLVSIVQQLNQTILDMVRT